MTHEDILEILEETGALLSGHFELASGRHSNRYFQYALLLQYPKKTEKICKELAGRFLGKRIDIVIGPAIGGVLVSFEVARQLGARSLFAERVEGKGPLLLRRNFQIQKDEKVLVIEDVITTGGSAKELIDLVRSNGGEVVGVGALADRSGGQVSFDVPFEVLLQVSAESFMREECPLCKEKVPFTKPGSRGLALQ